MGGVYGRVEGRWEIGHNGQLCGRLIFFEILGDERKYQSNLGDGRCVPHIDPTTISDFNC
jgi:hypothetical protein